MFPRLIIADVLKAQDVADVASGSAAAATGSPARLSPHDEAARRLTFAPEAMLTPSPTLPHREQPLTVESLGETVQQLMRDMAELRIQSEKQLVTTSLKIESQRLKLEEQAEAIAGFEAGAAEAEVESTAEAEVDWGYDQDGRWIGGHHDPWWSWHNGGATANDPGSFQVLRTPLLRSLRACHVPPQLRRASPSFVNVQAEPLGVKPRR